MRLRVAVPVIALALVVSACSQRSPELPPVDVPAEVVPDLVNPSDVDRMFPLGRGCLLAVGSGVRVLDVVDGTGASDALRPGDIMTSVDGTPVSSREILLQVLEDRRVGERVVVEGTRVGAPFSASIALSPVRGQTGRAILGVITETKLEAVRPTSLSEAVVDDQLARPVIVDGWIYRYVPLGAVWTPYPGTPAEHMAELGSDIYAVAAVEPLSLVRVGDEEPIAIDPGPVVYETPVGPLEVVASGFDEVVGSVGGLLLIAGEAEAGPGDTAAAVHAVDPVKATVEWIRPLGLSDEGNQLAAVDAYRSPSGDRALVALAEYDEEGGSGLELFNYYLVDEEGEGTVGPPGIDQFFPTDGVTGWYDDDSLIYLVDVEVPQIVLWSLGTGEHTLLRAYSAEEAFSLRTALPVGDGEHIVEVRDGEVFLVDVDRPELTRLISRGCRHEPVEGRSLG
ncbi:MAG: PDZ domain-containing protein [bacterium]|nr:PDZ domain-containing protein [bacterium]